MQSRGAGIDRNAFLRAAKIRECPLKALDARAGGQPAEEQCLDNRLDVGVGDLLPAIGQESLPGGASCQA